MVSTRLIASILITLALGGAAAADPLDDAVTKLTAAEAQVKSCTLKTRMTQNMDLGDGNKLESKSEGTVEWMRKGDKKLFRSDMKMAGTQKFTDQEIKLEQTMTMISDGEFSYTVTEDKGQKSAYKQKADASMQEDPKALMESLKEEYTVKLLPDEKVDGAECFVIEGTSKQKEGDPVAKQLLYFRKDSGICVKMVGRDAADKPVFTHDVSDLKLNTEIPAERFVFKKPEGVEMIDLTQQGEPAKEP